MAEPSRPSRGARRGQDVHQTHFFYRDDLAAGATVRDHVTGEAVGEVSEVGRHVFEGYGAPAPDGGTPGDLVVEVRELDDPAPAVSARPMAMVPATTSRSADEATVAEGTLDEATLAEEAPDEAPEEAPDEPTLGEAAPREGRARTALGASVAQGVAIVVLAPLLALVLLVVLLVLLVG